MTDIDPRLGDVFNYISVKLSSDDKFAANEYIYLNRHFVENMAAREVILRKAAGIIGRQYP
jgi:hypothetical protein